ncbi:MAG: hypothetical protein Q8O56_14030, partial [Solirubrobacteraceae bacterium]|nr:hypothetical protein [Solirubrobacteraceae bacterium]
MTAVVLADRLAALPELTLYRGGHNPPPANTDAADLQLCIREAISWVAGEPHSAQPACQCPVIGTAMLRFNDRVDDATRQLLLQPKVSGDPKTSLGVRSVGTRDDGYQTQRGYMASDFAVRIALPIWLDASGRTDAAQRLRDLPEIVDRATAIAARDIVREIRNDLPDWWAWRSELRAKVHATVLDALKNRSADAAAAAAA